MASNHPTKHRMPTDRRLQRARCILQRAHSHRPRHPAIAVDAHGSIPSRDNFLSFFPVPIPPMPPLPLRPSSSSLPRSLLTGPSLPLDPIEIHGCSPREPPTCCNDTLGVCIVELHLFYTLCAYLLEKDLIVKI